MRENSGKFVYLNSPNPLTSKVSFNDTNFASNYRIILKKLKKCFIMIHYLL